MRVHGMFVRHSVAITDRGRTEKKPPNASLANYWKEGQGRFQFVANISQRRAEAARKGVAVFTDRESRGYSDFARNPLRA